MSTTPETTSSEEELVLETPMPAQPTKTDDVASKIKVDSDTARRITTAVNSFVDSILKLEPQSPEFRQKVRSITRMGNEEIRRSAEASNRFLDRPTAALQNGPMAQGSQVSGALLALRKQIESLDPSRHLGRKRGIFDRL